MTGRKKGKQSSHNSTLCAIRRTRVHMYLFFPSPLSMAIILFYWQQKITQTLFYPCEWSGTRLHFGCSLYIYIHTYGRCVYFCMYNRDFRLLLFYEHLDSWTRKSSKTFNRITRNSSSSSFSLGEILRSRRDENRGHCTPFFFLSWADCWYWPVVVLMYTWIRWELFRMDGQVCLRQKEAGNFRERSSSSCRWVHQFLRGLTGPCSAGPLAGLFEPMIRTRPVMSHQKKKKTSRRRKRTATYNLHSFACVCSRSSTVVLPRKEICIHHLITPRHCWAVSLFFFSFFTSRSHQGLVFFLIAEISSDAHITECRGVGTEKSPGPTPRVY